MVLAAAGKGGISDQSYLSKHTTPPPPKPPSSSFFPIHHCAGPAGAVQTPLLIGSIDGMSRRMNEPRVVEQGGIQPLVLAKVI